MSNVANSKTLVVVLGMHRSGTSAVTCGLQVLGIELGDSLMPAVPGVNDKGFFEDTEINAINVELMDSLGLSWHTLALYPEGIFAQNLTSLRTKALEVLGRKFENRDCFGIKDPRLCRLLPFWKEVFAALHLDVSYVVVTRNPLSVASSLQRVHGLPPEKSHYLWLEHLLPALQQTAGQAVVVVDYDLFLAEPEKQLQRISSALLDGRPLDEELLDHFQTEFLDSGLRHEHFTLNDLENDSLLPRPVEAAASLVKKLAGDQLSPASAEVRETTARLAEQLEGMAQAMSYIMRLDQIIEDQNSRDAEQKIEIEALRTGVSEGEQQIGVLEERLNGRDLQLAAGQQTIEQQKVRISDLSHDLAERETRLADLESERDAQQTRITALQKALAERDTLLADLEQERKVRQERIMSLEEALAGRDARLADLEQERDLLQEDITSLKKTLAGRDALLVALESEKAKQGERLAALNGSLAEWQEKVHLLTTEKVSREQQLNSLQDGLKQLTETLEARTRETNELAGKLRDRDASLQSLAVRSAQFSYRLDRLRETRAWRIHKAWQATIKPFVNRSGRQTLGLLPFHQLRAENHGWQATGNDPQFLLVADRAWRGLSRWFWLEIDSLAEQPLHSELYFDTGEGFDTARIIHFRLSGRGRQKVPLFVPENCQAIRFDPCDRQAGFQINGLDLLPMKPGRLVKLPEEFQPQAVTFRALGGGLTNFAELRPTHQVVRQADADYCWKSLGEDPRFFLHVVEKLDSGWCRFELRIHADVEHGDAKLYFDYGAGFLEKDALRLPFKSGQLVGLIVRLQSPPQGLRLDPVECRARFSVDHLTVTKVGETLARKIMLERLIHCRSIYAGKAAGEVWQEIRQAAEEEFVAPNDRLVADYLATFLKGYVPVDEQSGSGDIDPQMFESAEEAEEDAAPELLPMHDLTDHDEDGYRWRSRGEDPWFLISGGGLGLSSGWCRIEMKIDSSIDRGNAKIYINFGEGFREDHSVHVPFVSGQITTLLAKLGRPPMHVRLDPLDCAAKFSVKKLSITNVPEETARQGALHRLAEKSSQYRGKKPEQIWEAIERDAAELQKDSGQLLYDQYRKTFPVLRLENVVSYTDWISRCEPPEFLENGTSSAPGPWRGLASVFERFREKHQHQDETLPTLESRQKSFRVRPRISVVMPVYNAPEPFLRKAIDSVINQSYPNWELCIADDASTETHVRTVLEEYRRADKRIKVIFREENGHISAASNSALTLAKGEYVALMDHDDELAHHALHYMVEAINRQPSAKILYSDEDKIDEENNRSEPHFKPDWNPDLFLSQNYVSHLGIYRRDLLKRIGGFRVGVEGSQDQDLLIRCLPHVADNEIVHVPRVLYHWRILKGSTALGSVEKSYTTEAGLKVLRDYFRSIGQDGVRVGEGLVPNTYRVQYPVPEPAPLVSLLIPTRDGLDMLEPCISSILDKTTYRNFEIIILDNESARPETHDYFRRIEAEEERVRVLPYPYPFNFSAINNFGVAHANGEIIGLINNDIEVISPDWLREMVSHAVRPEIGCVGAMLYYDDDTVQHGGVILGLGGVAGHSHKYFSRGNNGFFSRLKLVQNLSAVTAACLVVRKAVYHEVGGLDEDLQVAFNDVDFCIKVREAGYRNLWTPYAELYHHESKSRGAEDTPEKIARFNGEADFMKKKWGALLQRDPYYSPNLTLVREDFTYR